MTDAEKETIKNDVKKELNGFIEASIKLNLESIIKYFNDSPDFTFVSINGEINNYEKNKKLYEDAVNNFASLKLTTIKEEIKVLNNDYVYYVWQYNAEIILKDGTKIVYDKAVYTFLYQKIGGVWKIIHGHESGIPPAVTQPEKK
jgi:ketosteroid isomerase-like protein